MTLAERQRRGSSHVGDIRPATPFSSLTINQPAELRVSEGSAKAHVKNLQATLTTNLRGEAILKNFRQSRNRDEAHLLWQWRILDAGQPLYACFPSQSAILAKAFWMFSTELA